MTKSIETKLALLVLGTLFTWAIAASAGNVDVVPPNSFTAAASPSQLPPSPTPEPTQIPTRLAPSVTQKPTRTPAPPTATPRPTLTAEEELAFVKSMLETNGGCELPCWWGIMPGETTWTEVADQFGLKSKRSVWQPDDPVYYELVYGLRRDHPFPDYDFVLNIAEREGKIQSIEVKGHHYRSGIPDSFAQDWRRYSLDQILARLGRPSQVSLDYPDNCGEQGCEDIWYTLSVVYEDRGILIRYWGPTIFGDPIRVCPVFDQVEIIEILLPPTDQTTADRQASSTSLAQLTGMSLEMFYESFKAADNHMCLEVPGHLWRAGFGNNSFTTPSPRPTLSADKEAEVIVDMLQNNGGCELPCWWGITPGQTTWQSVKDRFEAYGKGSYDVKYRAATGYGTTPFERREPFPFDYSISHVFLEEDGIVRSIEIEAETVSWYPPKHFADDWQRYSLDQVLTRYGIPSRVWMRLWPDPGGYYRLFVFYDQLGFLVMYIGPAGFNPEPRDLCPEFDQVEVISLWLQPPKAITPLEDLIPWHHTDMLPLEQATDIDLQAFYRMFKETDTPACLTSPSNIWLPYP